MQEEIQSRTEYILENSFIGKIIEDEEITDIGFNGTELWLKHNQKGQFKASVQPTIGEVKKLIKQIADVQRKEITNSEPKLNTGIGYLRVNAMHDVISPDGMTFAIRVSRPRLAISSLTDMTTSKSREIEELFKVLIKAGSNITISGETGSGKTELQKLLVGYIPDYETVLLIEDTRDSHIKKLYPNKNIISWQTVEYEDKTKNITIQDLVRDGLRNNADRMLVSETRGEEAGDMLDSAKTNHPIITTLHANGAMNIPGRFIPMIRSSKAYAIMDDQLVGNEIVEFLRFGVHLEMESEDGVIKRRLKEIVEFTDFTPQGVIGTYLYQEKEDYDEKTGEYHTREIFNPLSEKTNQVLKNKRIYHLLPEVFKDRKGVSLEI